LGVLLPLEISIYKSIINDMKNFENDKKLEQHLSVKEKINDIALSTKSRGGITYEKEYATLTYQRRLSHPREVIWKALTDPKQLSGWMNTKAVINGRKGGTIDFVNTVSGFHTTGHILVLEANSVFEHEWHIAPNSSLPQGEPKSVIRWELEQDGDSDTLLTLTHSHLSKSLSLRFAPGWHAYLDRLESNLDNEELPDWMHRFAEIKELYSFS
jgi:uncharacterized protein YndB with AHSA1/START domain